MERHRPWGSAHTARTAALSRWVVCLSLAALPGLSAAQAPPPATTADDNAVLAPIECWSRTSASAVRVGEPFTLVLTCAVVETQSTTVVPDQSRLDPSVLQVAPFDVVRGVQAADVRTSTRRFFQYEYVLRFLGETIGQELVLTGPTIPYRVQSRVQGDAAVESRERQYILPAHTIRIVSLVPPQATDIRDRPPETFREIEARRFRANVFRIARWVLFGLGGVVAVWTVATFARWPTAARTARSQLVSDVAILGAAGRDLEEVTRERQRQHWTGGLTGRALTSLRIVSSCAIGRRVAQAPAQDALPASGQLLVRSIWPGSPAVYVSGSTTVEDLAQDIGRAEGDGRAPAAHLVDLHDALDTFTAAAYGRDTRASDLDLDTALGRALAATTRVRRQHAWIVRAARRLAQSLTALRLRVWAR